MRYDNAIKRLGSPAKFAEPSGGHQERVGILKPTALLRRHPSPKKSVSMVPLA